MPVVTGHVSAATRVLAGLVISWLGLMAVWGARDWAYERALGQGAWARAEAIWPQRADAWLQQSQAVILSDPHQALRAGQQAVRTDPQDWHTWAALAGAQFVTGDGRGALASAEAMVRHGHGFYANWRYANLLMLGGDTAGYRAALLRSLTLIPEDEMEDTLSQILDGPGLQAADLSVLVRRAQAENGDPLHRWTLDFYYLQALLRHGELVECGPWWSDLAAQPLPEGRVGPVRDLGQFYLVNLLQAGDAEAAAQVWELGRAHGLLEGDLGPTPRNRVGNAEFRASLDAGPLDWKSCQQCGVFISREGGDAASGAAVQLDFRGSQPDLLTVLSQPLLLEPGQRYVLHYEDRAAQPASGVFVEVTDGAGNPLAMSTPQAGAQWSPGGAELTTEAQPGLYTLIIGYARPRGTVPLETQVWLRNFSLTGRAEP